MNTRLRDFGLTVLVFLLAVSLTSSSLHAQITAQTGAISGRVTDQTGAIVPGATVTITSERGESQSKKSSESGDFTFALLQPGNYQVKVEATGFSEQLINQLPVRVTEITNLPVQLQVGASTTEVSVSADAVQVNTTNATLGEVITGAVVESLPLATRNFTYLLGNNAATASTLPDASVVGRGSLVVYVNGQRGTLNNLVINGIDANNLGQ